jgi:hemolysin III
LAIAGIALKWLLPSEPYWITVALYFGLGYSGLIPLIELKHAVGLRGLKWALGGGALYTFGGLIDLFEWPIIIRQVIGHHELFHLCSMAGSFCHFVFMMLFVVPFPGYGSNGEILPAAGPTVGSTAGSAPGSEYVTRGFITE